MFLKKVLVNRVQLDMIRFDVMSIDQKIDFR